MILCTRHRLLHHSVSLTSSLPCYHPISVGDVGMILINLEWEMLEPAPVTPTEEESTGCPQISTHLYQYIIYFYYYQNYQGAGCGYELMGYFAIDLGLVSKAWVHWPADRVRTHHTTCTSIHYTVGRTFESSTRTYIFYLAIDQRSSPLTPSLIWNM